MEHQAASLTQITETARVRRDDDAASSLARGDYFREAKAGNERVYVDDVRALRTQPAMEMFSASNGDVALRLVAGWFVWNRISKHLAAVDRVSPRQARSWLRSSDEHLVSNRTQCAGQRGNIHLRAADTVGVIPPGGLNDLHDADWFDERFRGAFRTSADTGMMNSPSVVSGVPATACRFGGRK